jgi:hypothetical protein
LALSTSRKVGIRSHVSRRPRLDEEAEKDLPVLVLLPYQPGYGDAQDAGGNSMVYASSRIAAA